MDLTPEDFACMSQEKQINKLYENQMKLEVMMGDMCGKLDTLLKSPWRLSQPIIKWCLGAAVLIAGIFKGWTPEACIKALSGIIGG